MPQVLESNQTRNFPHFQTDDYTSVFYNGVYYPEERDDDMGESSVHIKLLANLLSILKLYFKNRQDVFLSGNMNLYFEKGNSRKWFAPDLLVAFGVPNVERSSYLLFREKVFPQVIFEIASEKTWRNDIDEKLRTYEQYGAEEYYVLDPEYAYLSAPLMAFRRENDKLSLVPVTDDRIFSPRLGLEIIWMENSFRLFDPNANEFLRTLEESEGGRRIAETEIERLKAEIERLKAGN